MSEADSKRIFQKKFNALLSEQRITQKEVALICGVSTSTVSTWSNGQNMPRMNKVERLANHFSLPKSYFIEEDADTIPPNSFPFTANEQELVSLYRELNEEGQDKLLDYADDLVSSGKYIKPDSPELGGPAQA